MSYGRIRAIPIVPNMVRDFHFEHEAAADFGIDLFQEHRVIGLDWALFNLGAAPITISIDNGAAITIPASGSRGFDNIKFATLRVISGVDYTLIIAGVSI